jgi:uncharacterized RDD family membrane protein YckC
VAFSLAKPLRDLLLFTSSRRTTILSSRKPGYLLGLFLLVVLCSVPHLLVLFKLTSDAVIMRRLPFQFNQSWGRVAQRGGLMSHATFAQDRFLHTAYGVGKNGKADWSVMTVDPRTRIGTYLKVHIRGVPQDHIQLLTFGPRLWLVGNTEAYEMIGDEARPSTMVKPLPWVAEPQRFLLDGEPAIIVKSGAGFAVSTFKSGAWGVSETLLLPDGRSKTIIDGVPINLSKALNVICNNQGDRIDLFLEVDGWLLYREGLDLQSVAGLQVRTVGVAGEPTSALLAENTARTSNTWTVVSKVPIADVGNNVAVQYRAAGNKFGLIVDGHPAALLVDVSDPGTMIGHLFRFDGQSWTEFATQTFPFGTAAIRVAVTQDGQTSFIVATTSTGVVNAYEVDSSAVRATPGNKAVSTQEFVDSNAIVDAFAMLVGTLMLAAVLGFGTAILMWYYTESDYTFGARRVRLAAIARRGVARVIDLGLIGLSAVALATWLTQELDWLSLAEALNLQLPHPTVSQAVRTVWTLVMWFVLCEMLLVLGQARWGLTIGKWCCGLRTLQTSLKPRGFTGSLVRELLFFVDVCGFLCWTPGIVSIALTDRRQRLGDIIADTVVVDVSGAGFPPKYSLLKVGA